MAHAEHLKILRGGVEKWNDWRKHAGVDIPDLSGASLCNANLIGVNFSGANLIQANLEGALIGGANLHHAYLKKANLRDVDLRESILAWADLEQAFMAGAYLRGVNFIHANLRYVDLTGATVGELLLIDADLFGAQGLLTCKHYGPSTIDHRTVRRSETVPKDFLRRCGVPESMIDPLLTCRADVSCFISYSTKDREFAERLHADMCAKELRCWFAPEDLKIGDPFQERIEESIRAFDRVMIVLSEASVQSRWVEREVNAAREREDRENRLVLFPIRIDDAVMNAPQPWAADIRRTRQIGDFREWETHSAYLKALERLLRDLKATDRASEQPA